MRGLQPLLDEIAREMAGCAERGQPAGYIPELAGIDPAQFAIAVAPIDGPVCVAGDADTAFSLQSITKVFTLALALERVGAALWARVGREPSGNRFNSVVQLEYERGIPRNPFINAGAIVLADALLEGRRPAAVLAQILEFVRDLAGPAAPGGAGAIGIDQRVASSEAATGHRNRALASFMRAEGNLRCEVEDVLAVYTGHCAIAMTVRQLALAGRFLAEGGLVRGTRRVPADRARRINALMLTCGHYDASGEFAFRVGIPGKSGVGGGILAAVPGRASIAVWSPGLGAKGNSLLAGRALERLADAMGWSVFGAMR
ncbi:MAG: glutaminase [Pseudomonadota bacterium]